MSAELITTKQFVNTNLKAYYRFESGTYLTTDSSGESHTLTEIGKPIEDASGQFGGAVELVGNGTDLTLGDTSSAASTATNYWLSQEFVPTKKSISSVGLQLRKYGSPTGNITVEIQTDNGSGAPSGTVLASATYNSASLSTSFAEINFVVPCQLTPDTHYHCCLKGQAAWDASKYVNWSYKSGTYSANWRYGEGTFDNALTTREASLTTYYQAAYSATDHADFKPTGNFTVGGWIKTSSVSQRIFQSFSINTNYAGIQLAVSSGGKAYLTSGKNNGTTLHTNYETILGTTTVTDGNWNFIVGTWDGSYLRIYTNGGDEQSVAWSYAPAYAATNYVRVGCQCRVGTNEVFMNGSLDDVFLINGTALSADQIKGIYDGKTNFKLNIGDDWKDADYAYINIGDAWKPVTEAKINIGDTWKSIF
jgi:hypothetical protein